MFQFFRCFANEYRVVLCSQLMYQHLCEGRRDDQRMIVLTRQVANVSRRSFFLASRYFILATIYNTQIIRGISVFTPLPMGEG